MRTLVASGRVLFSPEFVGDTGEPNDCDETPTLTVVTSAGVELDAPGVTAVPGDGRYRATLTHTDHTAQLDVLTCTWTGAVDGIQQTYSDTLEVVGFFLVSERAIRARLAIGTADASPSSMPVEQLAEIRDAHEDTVEQVCGVSFAPAYFREQLYGCDQQTLQLTKANPRVLRSVTLDGVAQDLAGWAVDPRTDRLIRRSSTIPSSTDGTPNVVVGYEHGAHKPAPSDLRHELLESIVAEARASRSKRNSQEISQQLNGMTIRYSTPDPSRGRPTGVLRLDPILVRETMRMGIA